jgi:hypothetical protein
MHQCSSILHFLSSHGMHLQVTVSCGAMIVSVFLKIYNRTDTIIHCYNTFRDLVSVYFENELACFILEFKNEEKRIKW